MEKFKSCLKNEEDAEEMLKYTINFFRNSVKCGNSNDDNYNEFTYNMAVENLLMRGVCGGQYNKIDNKVVTVAQEHCKKIGIDMPQIKVSHFPFENLGAYVYGMATPSNKVEVRVGYDDKICQSEKMKQDCIKATIVEAYRKKRYQIAKDFLEENAVNELAFAYGNLMHELEHIRQYAMMKDCAKGVRVLPFYELMLSYAVMRVANCKANKNVLKTLYTDLGYIYCISEVDARISTIENLRKMYLEAELSEECRQKILDVLKYTTYEELVVVKNHGKNYNKLVLQQLDRSKKVFAGFYGETDLGQQILEIYRKLIKKPQTLEKMEVVDKNLMKYAGFALEQESSSKFGQIAQIAIEGKIDEILQNDSREC